MAGRVTAVIADRSLDIEGSESVITVGGPWSAGWKLFRRCRGALRPLQAFAAHAGLAIEFRVTPRLRYQIAPQRQFRLASKPPSG
ncbi:MAG: hypothetical protein CMJ58_20965 [Planctomycetaceae bacterium]|nr:hypothetical protein [Planctomycetaceae bacterium]